MQDLGNEKALAYIQGAHYLVDDARIAHTKLINLAQSHPLNSQDPVGEIEDNTIMGVSTDEKFSVSSGKGETNVDQEVFPVWLKS